MQKSWYCQKMEEIDLDYFIKIHTEILSKTGISSYKVPDLWTIDGMKLPKAFVKNELMAQLP